MPRQIKFSYEDKDTNKRLYIKTEDGELIPLDEQEVYLVVSLKDGHKEELHIPLSLRQNDVTKYDSSVVAEFVRAGRDVPPASD
jgi:hypothetical protein